MSTNIQRLGNTLAGRMKTTAARAIPTTMELGTITQSMSLVTDSLRSSIPKGEYMVNILLTADAYRTTEEQSKTDDEEKHSHSLPDTFRGLQAGDRVLVAWCGHDPIVICILTSS